MSNKSRQYSNGEITVHWKPSLCTHAGFCAAGLPDVFKPKAKPWVDVTGADTEAILAQVKKCPSGALSSSMNDTVESIDAADCTDVVDTISEQSEAVQIEVVNFGPLLVKCDMEVTHADGKKEVRKKMTAFCRCGASTNKPYCDGTHRALGEW